MAADELVFRVFAFVFGAVIGSYLVFRDSHHLTTPFATALAGRLLASLPPLPGSRGG